jgi:hypothetical protein
MFCVVSPEFQLLFIAELLLNSTEFPKQKVVNPLAVINGVAGSGSNKIVVAKDEIDAQPLLSIIETE